MEVDIALGAHDVVRPDLSGWRRERLLDPAERRPITEVPDWGCEISSPSTAVRDRVTKRELYARSGVGHYWIIDVDTRVLEAFSLHDARWTLVGSYDASAVQVRIPPFEAVALDVARLFLP